MKSKYKSLVKNIELFTIGSFGSRVISFLMVPLYTSVLSTSDYGQVDLLTATAQLLMPILLLSIPDATLRFGMDPDYDKKDVISSTVSIILEGSMVLLIGIAFFYFANFLAISAKYYIFLFFTFLSGSISNCFNIYLRAKDKVSVITISGILCTLIMCTSNVVCLLVLKLGVDGYMISNLIGVFIQIICKRVVSRNELDGICGKAIRTKKFNNDYHFEVEVL